MAWASRHFLTTKWLHYQSIVSAVVLVFSLRQFFQSLCSRLLGYSCDARRHHPQIWVDVNPHIRFLFCLFIIIIIVTIIFQATV